MEEWKPSRFEAEGSVETENGPVSYRVISEDFVINGEDGEPEASIFAFSYFRTDCGSAGSARPVAFFWNGGPGAASIWLHTGMMGPVKMRYEDAVHPPVNPPYEMEENRYWLLDVCDLVMVDPVGTGYSVLLKPEKAEDYYSACGDARAIADFIETWLRKYGRRNSPVYLGGESYGTIRTPLVVQELMCGPSGIAGKMRGIAVKGVFLLGTVLDIGAEPLPVPREPMDLYTMTAVAWYHSDPDARERFLRDILEEVWQFGCGEYLNALFLQHSLTDERRREVARKLSFYTDIDEEYFLENGLRISLEEFGHRMGQRRGFDLGMYDGRYTMPHRERRACMDPVIDDPAMGSYTPSMTGAFEAILKRKLNISLDREYRAITFQDVNMRWAYTYRVPPRECLELAARRNPDFRIFLGAGLYDLVTSPGYARALESQLAVPRDRIVRREYESGHMPYLGEESLAALTRDMRAFLL